MDTAFPQKFPFFLDRNLAKANCTENRVYTSYDTVVLDICIIYIKLNHVPINYSYSEMKLRLKQY